MSRSVIVQMDIEFSLHRRFGVSQEGRADEIFCGPSTSRMGRKRSSHTVACVFLVAFSITHFILSAWVNQSLQAWRSSLDCGLTVRSIEPDRGRAEGSFR